MDLPTPSESAILRDLWTLITVTTAPADEFECARLTATGIPAAIPCAVSAAALQREGESGWKLLMQRNGAELGEAELQPLVPALDDLFDRAVRWGDVFSISDPVSVPSALADLGIGSLAVVPVRNLRARFGVILAGRSEPSEFSVVERFALETLAEHLAITLENLRLRGSLERYSKELQRHSDQLERLVEERTAELRVSNDRHRALLDLDISLRATTETSDLLRSIAPILSETLPFERSTVILRDEGPGALFAWNLSAGSSPSDAPERLSATEGGVFEHCFSRCEAIVRNYGDDESRFRFPEDRLLWEDGYRTLATVPLATRDRCVGSLDVSSRRSDAFAAADVGFLSLVASRLAAAIDNAQAYQEVRRLRDQLEVDNLNLRQEIKTYHNLGEIIGRSPGFVRALEKVEAVAATDATVLILGETGTGKELVARAVHDRSSRHERTLVKLNCAALPSGLVESELFGHEKGAFTGALARKRGRFELADGGTLFLDEIGEVSLDVQAKLLRVLQEGEFERVGGDQTHRVDVRVVAATNRDLESAVESGTFRVDLYYRLAVFPIEIPPLRERPEDIPTLAIHLAEKAAARLGKPFTGIGRTSLDRLARYSWPGNVRELENVIERAVILCPHPELEIDNPSGPDLIQRTTSPERRESEILTDEAFREFERKNLLAALDRAGGKIYGPGGAAEILGLKPTTVASRLQRLGIKRPDSV